MTVTDPSDLDLDNLPEEYEPSDEPSEFDLALALTEDEFAAMTVKQQNKVIFTLLRDMAGEVRALADKAQSLEDRATAMATPEGMQELVQNFMGNIGGGLGGLMRF